ncbi:MATH domain and coiled-coil domain-containing protein At3g58400-like [Rosa rugosa]|uniref:MATH domain and coiled-coil domain-containing protein At3g58400-like n=1 Tax=Rosa rugosa TaxID=74645 RepID=UPI002B409B43|nr:MATH domain and coiled-coil domain-containing protein At3g58400-like [Rosa rugosa]
MENQNIGVTRSKRDLPPAHFSLKIQTYSLLPKTEVEKYDSGVFEAGGHKWRLSIHPNETEEGIGYISLYLAIAETDTYPEGWEVYADYKLFVLDHLQKKYLTVQDFDMKRFHKDKTEWGFAKLLTLEAFKNSSNGYLVDDCCEFGAEVFVYSRNKEWESLAMVKEPSDGTFRYEMENFSAKAQPSYYSKVFTVGERNWKLRVWPKGNAAQRDKAISIYLNLDDWKSLPPKRALYAKYKLRILDQVSGKHEQTTGSHWFSSSSSEWGYPIFNYDVG